jgi:hypothetical protein
VLARAAALALLWSLGVASAASAGSASVTNGTLTFNAAPGEKNTLNVSYDASLNEYRLTDTSAPVRGGSGCGAIDDEIDCAAARVVAIVVFLNDNDDVFTQGPLSVIPAVQGGDGNDRLTGSGILEGEAGDDTLMADDNGATLVGGDGNDRLVGRAAGDVIDGGPGDDVLIGGDGDDRLVGGLGLDRVNAGYEGANAVDCQGRDDDIVRFFDSDETFSGCGGPPNVTAGVRRERMKRFLAQGLPLTVTCDEPCSLRWQVALDRPTQRIVRGSRWVARHVYAVDEDGFDTPAAGPQRFTVTVPTARVRRLARVRSMKLTIRIQAMSRSGRTRSVSQQVAIG